ncbi:MULTISPECIES: hypothetical protein [unclassified Microbacterium]|uniref:hypothetical protein n=1 Tax=unclassified Microbacterium TaxID=2609290 RepID=UPI003015B6D8
MKFLTWFLGLFVICFIFMGFVVDSFGKVQMFQEAQTTAQSAARAGTNAATGASVNGDAFNISGPMAATAAQNYLASAGVRGMVTVGGDTVTVTVEMTYLPHMLGPIPLPPIPVHATGSARLIGN